MAGIKEGLSKGLATLNVKTSNFMEENKLKTGITTKESEIAAIKSEIGEIVFINRESFTMDMVADKIEAILERCAAIDSLKAEIEALSKREADILGAQPVRTNDGANAKMLYCTNCGAGNGADYKFCEKCGNKLI